MDAKLDNIKLSDIIISETKKMFPYDPFQRNSQQELEMWFAVAQMLKAIPKLHRSQNHTAYYNEVQGRVYDLVNRFEPKPI